MKKRFVSAVGLIICLFIFSGTAIGYDYEGECPPPNVYVGDKWNFFKCECTSYVAWALNNLWKKTNRENPQFNNSYRQPVGQTWGDAVFWCDAANRAGISVTSNVWMVGDVAKKDGHVLFVEKINRNPNNSSEIYSIEVSDYNKTDNHESGRYTLVPGTSSYPDKFIHVTYTQMECTDTGLCDDITKNIGVPGGAGGETPATDQEDPGKPDFIVKRLELSNYNPSKNDEIKARAKLKNIGENDIDSDDKIETRFYLSMGYKEDLHSEWIRIGREYTKGSNLDPGETHWEEETLRLWEYNQIQPGQVYNIVACVDRIKDSHNKPGDYEEEHESNNCSTEAVFTVADSPPPPPPQTTSPDGKFAWSCSGPISGMVCVQIIEPADPHTWNDNYFCGNQDYGMQWSCCGPISNMKNTQINEPADPHTWDDNYLAVPNDSNINFSWSSAGPIAGLNCVQWIEPADPDTWDDNYLCYTIDAPPPPPPPPAEYNFSITNLTFSIKDRVKLWSGEAFSVSTTAYNSGDNPSGNVQVGYYLDDVLIGTDTISASDFPHGSYRSEALENAIAPSEPGDHTARVCVDYNNQIQETDESDNCQSITIKVEKHLSPAVIQMLFN